MLKEKVDRFFLKKKCQNWTWHEILFLSKIGFSDRNILDEVMPFRAEQDWESFEKKMNMFFNSKKYRTHLDGQIISQYTDALREMDSSKEVFLVKYEELLHNFNDIPCDRLSVYFWKELALVTNANGLFRLGQLCRNRAKMQAMASNDSLQKCLVLLEDGDYNSAIEIAQKLNSKETNVLVKSIYKKIIGWAATLNDQREYYAEYLPEIKNNEIDFYDYIEKKHLRIIGPAPVDYSLEYCNEDDCILRFNYYDKKTIEKEDPIKKVNITYLSSYCCNKYNVNDIATNLDYTRTGIKINEQMSNKSAQFDTMYDLYFSGQPNMLQNCLYDLAKNGKRNISVERVNLYLGNVWAKNYNAHSQKEQEEMFWWPILACHELESQFLILKRMKEAELIVPSEELDFILKYSKEEYIELMEKKWVMSTLPNGFKKKWKCY